jgi:MFS transporter, PPP family, 3-phenylpropionic acid transporter
MDDRNMVRRNHPVVGLYIRCLSRVREYWRAKGLNAATIGGLWGLAVMAEIALFAVSARFPQRIGSLSLLGIGALGAVLRWGAMDFNPPLVMLPMLQLLHAFSLGATSSSCC